MLYDSPDAVALLPVDLAEDPTLAPVSDSPLDGILEAYRQQGYDAGYSRALNDVLADFLLFTQRLLRNADPDDRNRLRRSLRSFETQLESSLAGQNGRVYPVVEGGLGI